MLINDSITFSANMSNGLEASGAWLKSQRELAGVSQQKAADRAELNVIHISRAENGRTGLKRGTVIKLVEAINTLSTGHKIDVNEALARFGHVSEIPTRPTNKAELIAALERIGVEHIEFEQNLENSTPDELQEVFDAVKIAVEITLSRQGRKK